MLFLFIVYLEGYFKDRLLDGPKECCDAIDFSCKLITRVAQNLKEVLVRIYDFQMC
jgi:hypothetical protein